MRILNRLLAILSDLRLAIALLLIIAVASGVGTILPQQEAPELYLERFNSDPWLGLINGGADALTSAGSPLLKCVVSAPAGLARLGPDALQLAQAVACSAGSDALD